MMTLDEFRASRAYHADLRLHPSEWLADCYADNARDCGGYVYCNDLVIDGPDDTGDFCCTIGNESRLGTLHELEAWLYEFAVNEGWL